MKNLLFILIALTVCFSSAHAQTYFNISKKFPVSSFDPNPNMSKIRPIKSTETADIFQFISKKSKVQFNYPQGGCPERALIVHYLLDSLKVSNFKIWIFAPSRLIEGDKRKIYVNDKNGLSKSTSNKIEWDFHVASCILEQKSNGKIDTMVVDPSINVDKVLPYKEWINSISNKEAAEYSFTDGKYYSFNRKNNGNSNVIDGFFYPYVGWSYDNLFLEKMLALNDVAYALFKKYVDGKDRTNKDIQTVIETIENSATLKEVLEYKDGSPASTKIRFLISNHSDFVADAWALYANKFAYWGRRVSKLYN